MIAFAVVGLFSPMAGAAALSPAQSDSLDATVGAYLQQNHVPGLTLAIAQGGELIWNKGYGLADLENEVPATAETQYRSASIGKPMTATAALRLVEENKLDLEAPIQQYCPAFPAKRWPITAHQLITHTAGIRHYGGPRDFEEQNSNVHYESVAAALDPFKQDSLLFEPGTDYSYSTYGYDVLGCVVEGAAGVPFLEAMAKLVFGPAGMAHTRDDDPSVIIPDRAAGYRMVDGILRNAPHVDMSNRLAAGGYITTASDLARFGMRFTDCQLVGCKTRDLMWTELSLRNGDTVNYAMGWGIGEYPDGKLDGTVYHGGSSPGVSGMLYLVPARRLVVAMLCNLEDVPRRLPFMKHLEEILLAKVGQQ